MHVSSAANSSQHVCVLNKENKDKIKSYSNYPICADTTNICNGFRPLLCKNVISGNVTLPSKNELSAMNRLKRKEHHRENARNRRKLQKQKNANIQPNCILEPIAENRSLPKYNTDTEV